VPLSDAQLEWLHDQLGSEPADAELEARFDRLGSAEAVAASVVEVRLTALTEGPDSFSLSGVYSESNSKRITALEDKLRVLRTGADAANGIGVARSDRLSRPDTAR